MTLNDLNKNDYRDLVILASEFNASEVNLRKVIPVGNAASRFTIDCIRPKKYKKILANFPALERESGIFINSEEPLKHLVDPKFNRRACLNGQIQRGCPAGIWYAYIDPEGRMRPCSNIPVIIGDLKEKSFWDIWDEHYWMKRLRRRDFEKCIHCKFKNICGGCRAMAKLSSGNWWGIDPNCWV